MPEIPLNIFVPQAFIQQRQSKGDSVASCSINATGITLKWMSESGRDTSKYVPLNRSNIGIAFTASGYKNFKAFAAMFTMPATYISDDEEDEVVPSPSSTSNQSAQLLPLLTMILCIPHPREPCIPHPRESQRISKQILI